LVGVFGGGRVEDRESKPAKLAVVAIRKMAVEHKLKVVRQNNLEMRSIVVERMENRSFEGKVQEGETAD
jgi:hypothetical protein